MPYDDTKKGLDAKVPGELAKQFTVDNRLSASIAKASPEAQEDVWEQMNRGKKALESSANWQQDTRVDRVSKERARLMERYLRDPAPRPNTPEARQNDLKIIDEQSDRNITQRDKHHLESTKRVTKSMVYQILQEDRQNQQSQQHGHGDPEQELER